MKNYVTILFLVLCTQGAFSNTFYQQLCDFNFNWNKYMELAPEEKARIFNSEKEYIQAHLESVLRILETNPISHLDKKQYRSRLSLIETLDRYQIAGNFPINYYRQERIPVFIDEHDTHCAVGYLLKETGHGAMAFEISKMNNYAWIKDINHLGFEEWQQKSGLSLEELKLIQGAYDYYFPNALVLPNKYEVPQKPEVMTMYFDKDSSKKSKIKKKENIWCYGEGENNLLNGQWIQNFAVGVPWIEGYFENGKRTGQWKEYYQGTDKLCRTENWRNDKLNGVRKRFDRSGNLIEEILFKNGKAITKTNYDLGASLKWIRKPLDSNLMQTEVYTFGGALLAEGKEKVHNPGNLLWFQNIELTALNSAAITSRNAAVSSEAFKGNGLNPGGTPGRGSLYNTPPLVEYKKEGKWIYHKEVAQHKVKEKIIISIAKMLKKNYLHFGDDLSRTIGLFNHLDSKLEFDSIDVIYSDNKLEHFYGHGKNEVTHLIILYHDNIDQSLLRFDSRNAQRYSWYGNPAQAQRVKEIGQFDLFNQKVGIWKHFDRRGRLVKTENYIIPWREEEILLGMGR